MAIPEKAASRWKEDAVSAIGVLGILAMMIVPLPPMALSFFHIMSIALSITVLLMTTIVKEVLEFSVFPSLLLGLTLLRLALNVVSTRLILIQGDAGVVVEAFGKIVAGGDPVVGFVVFLILVIVQFVVITKGAERVSEVAARFTLDALPGKQMGVDAELNAGLIDEKQARARREAIQREADFYGAMDGASKFVRGDAIAAMVIVAINLVGGVMVGMLRRNMNFVDVLRTYTILTIGDGLAHQIPALVVSTAAGILVTRTASKAPLGEDLIRQMQQSPRAIMMAGAVLSVLGVSGVVTGLPVVPFVLVGGGLLWGGWALKRRGLKPLAPPTPKKEEASPAVKPGSEDVSSLLAIEPFELELGYGLLFLVDPARGGDLLDRVGHLRRQCARDLGIVVPPVRIRDSNSLPNNAYAFKIKGIEVARGELMPRHYLVMGATSATPRVKGLPTVEPTFGLPALWVREELRREAELEGLTVVDNGSVVATHLSEVLRAHAHEILGRQDVQNLITDLKNRGQSAVIDELIPAQINLGTLHRILQNLLRERVSIRNMVTILEALSEGTALTKDPELLTEYARSSLGRQISLQHRGPDKKLLCLTLSPELERKFSESLQKYERGGRLAIDPDLSDRVVKAMAQAVSRAGIERPTLLCSGGLRPYVRRHFERFLPNLVVLSYNEITADTKVESVGVIESSEAVHAA